MFEKYQVTLNQGRTDTVTVEANSFLDVKTFFETVSTANITFIKEILYSKKLGIGSLPTSASGAVPLIGEQYKLLLALLKTDSFSGTVSIDYPSKKLTKDKMIDIIKDTLFIRDEPVIEVLNLLIYE